MYIIEKLIKLCLQLKNDEVGYQAPAGDDVVELEDVVTCRHNFMPIDSTGRILACSKCGYLITKKNLLKKKNFFIDSEK